MGNYDHSRRAAMRWKGTLGDMLAEGTRVIRSCSACDLWGEVDLDHMVALLGGADMTLWDCRPPCPYCGQPMTHLASPARGTPYRPLTSDVPDHIRPLPAQAWMAGWLGRR